MIRTQGAWDVVAMDGFGPLSETQEGNKHVLVVIDHFTKWVELVPMPTITASATVEVLHQIFCRMGWPRVLLSDLGPMFISQVVRAYCQRYGVYKAFTTAYHPQSDPQAENFMKLSGNSLTILSHQHHRDWDRLVDAVAFAHRNSLHPSLGDTPFFVTFGRDPNTPYVLFETSLTAATPQHLLRDRHKLYVDTCARIHASITAAAACQKATYDAHQHEVDIQIGDLVLYRTSKDVKEKKLEFRWSLPYRVIKVLPGGKTLNIRHCVTKDEKLANIQQVRKFRPWESSATGVRESSATEAGSTKRGEPSAAIDLAPESLRVPGERLPIRGNPAVSVNAPGSQADTSGVRSPASRVSQEPAGRNNVSSQELVTPRGDPSGWPGGWSWTRTQKTQ